MRALHEKHPKCIIFVVDVKPPEDAVIENIKLQYFEASTTSADDLRKAFQAARPQVVIHSAAIIPSQSERYGRRLEKVVLEVNVEGTRHVLDAARQSGCSALVYTSSCCAVTDDMSVSYINIDERWPVSPVSSIYGESKVCSQIMSSAPQVTFLGPSRGTGAGRFLQVLAYMHTASISVVWQGRYAIDPLNTCLSCKARDTLDYWRWH